MWSIGLALPAGGLYAAGPPVAYDGWTVSEGTIETSASCGAGVTCTTLSADDGFLQEMVDDGVDRYIRIILTDPGEGLPGGSLPADLGFAAETFVRFAHESDPSALNGITSKLAIREAAGVETFDYSAFVQRGWGRGTGSFGDEQWSLLVDQLIVGQDIVYGAKITTYNEGWFTDVLLGRMIDIFQEVTTDPDAGEKQAFVWRDRAGAAGRYCFSVQFSCRPLTGVGNMTLGGETVAWESTNDIATTWLADNINADIFGYQKIDNRTTGATANESSFDAYGPFAWDPIAFGAEPTFP